MEEAARDHTARAGFAMPAEWAPHSRCWMAWPCRTELWGERMPAARKACAEIAKAIVAYEPVTMIARPDLAADASLHCGQGISVLPLEHDDSWIRDIAPTFVLDQAGALAGVDWRYNGYGERAPAYDRDARLAEVDLRAAPGAALCRADRARGRRGARRRRGHRTGVRAFGARSEAQSGPRPRRASRSVLADCLGIAKVIWLEHGFEGDLTGGHVDNVACFVRPGVVMVLTCRDADDANFAGFQDNLARLRARARCRGARAAR